MLHDSDHLSEDMISTLCSFPHPSQVTASCPAVCECPDEPLVCPPGVSSVPDGCGCCKVCASQLNQDCGHMRPCDHHKGLECNYGNDVTMAWGICRGEREEGTGRESHSENSFLYYSYLHCSPDGGHSVNMEKESYI